MNFDVLPSPAYVVDETLLRKNLEILQHVKQETGCKILLAQKGFSMFYFYPLMREYLDGTTASGSFEARLGYEEFGGETHIFSPAFTKQEIETVLPMVEHIVFNTPTQLKQYKPLIESSGKRIEIGLRVNPEFSTQASEHAIYDPSAKFSRLGTTLSHFDERILSDLDGLHFHTLCQQNSDDLEKTVAVFEEKFGRYLHGMKWVNFGGGHHITRADYDIDRLIRVINRIKKTYDVQVYLEPGEAVALNTGFLVATVIDINFNEMNIAILDTSASCHMPDVLEMPYRPEVIGAGLPNEKAYTYRFGGPTCLAGDIIGDYSFDKPLTIGDRVVFTDMAHYSMVKNNTFNGMPLPTIAAFTQEGEAVIVKQFGYADFKERLS
ncbi:MULTISPECIES: carboxynorspermidine decarboxylase [unclassified Granulicatella]|uniref:carboxynorspermidine decarboxylase n=1 Tax=unclassified Granulicatella TaxID=2630493 RepID=UPI0010730441|nr:MULTISPECIES: carboxynorspermidine decarboxylase [unclassified Granulicatella]MBF0780301.1 carboxynorspermidine decarboxylase [Granulicatella sp. 19428wC4_WM01]TFU95579.1 carboxynorspermidine decarboxylase [Granulicatella sp. WM01]